MSDTEFKNCIPQFGKEDAWKQAQLDALAAKLKRAGVSKFDIYCASRKLKFVINFIGMTDF